jgi:hypothetical protein
MRGLTTMATVATIRDAMRAQPFRPFDLKLVDGTHYVVNHPEHVAIPPVRRPREIVYFEAMDEEEYRSRAIDLGLVLEVVTPTEVPPRAQAAEQR